MALEVFNTCCRLHHYKCQTRSVPAYSHRVHVPSHVHRLVSCYDQVNQLNVALADIIIIWALQNKSDWCPRNGAPSTYFLSFSWHCCCLRPTFLQSEKRGCLISGWQGSNTRLGLEWQWSSVVKKEKKGGGCFRGLFCGICESNLFSCQRTKFVAMLLLVLLLVIVIT